MPDATIATDAANRLMDANPVLGSICVILALGIVYLFYQSRVDIRKERDDAQASINQERDRHENTRQAHYQDLNRMAALGEAMRAEQEKTRIAMESAIKFMEGKGRS